MGGQILEGFSVGGALCQLQVVVEAEVVVMLGRLKAMEETSARVGARFEGWLEVRALASTPRTSDSFRMKVTCDGSGDSIGGAEGGCGGDAGGGLG